MLVINQIKVLVRKVFEMIENLLTFIEDHNKNEYETN